MPVYVVMLTDDMATLEHAKVFTNYGAMEQYVLGHAQERLRNNYTADWCYVVMYDGIDVLEKTFLYWCSKDGRILNRSPLES